MKRVPVILAMTIGFIGTSIAQQPAAPQPPDPNAPTLTLEEKITLATDDLKKTDVLEKAQKSYLEAIKPIQDHQDAAKAAIEKEHPGWNLVLDQQGWHYAKKAEPKPAEKPAETPKK